MCGMYIPQVYSSHDSHMTHLCDVWYVPQVSDLFAVCTDERRRPRSALSGLTDEGDGGRCVSLLRKGCGVGWRGFQFAKMKVDIPV